VRPDSAVMRLTGPARRRLLWPAGAALAAALTAVVIVVTSQGNPAPMASATTTVQRGTVTLAISAAGTITAADSRGLSFSAAGTVTEVNVKAGDLVTVGEVLARIDPAASQATVDTAQSRVDDAQAAADRAAAAAAVPTCPPTTAPAAATPAGSTSPGSTSPGPSTGTGKSPGGGTGGSGATGAGATPTCAAGRSSSATDSLLSAQQQLNNAKLALTQAQKKLAGTVLTAPIAGRALSVAGKVGATASPGGTGFVVLGDIASLAVTAQFSEADVGRLAVGQSAAITLPNSGTSVSGKVSQIDPTGTTSNQLVTYGVVIAFDAVPTDQLIGESATVLVTTASVADVLYVASAAVTGVTGSAGGSGGSGTVTVRAGGHDEQKTVAIGLHGDQFTEIRGGLSLGDQVVLPSGA
jgi:multidrug efflux pump subunit AcrA (membrane-fusion protein)